MITKMELLYLTVVPSEETIQCQELSTPGKADFFYSAAGRHRYRDRDRYRDRKKHRSE